MCVPCIKELLDGEAAQAVRTFDILNRIIGNDEDASRNNVYEGTPDYDILMLGIKAEMNLIRAKRSAILKFAEESGLPAAVVEEIRALYGA